MKKLIQKHSSIYLPYLCKPAPSLHSSNLTKVPHISKALFNIFSSNSCKLNPSSFFLCSTSSSLSRNFSCVSTSHFNQISEIKPSSNQEPNQSLVTSINVNELKLKPGELLLIKRYSRVQPCIIVNLFPLSSILENGALVEHNVNDICFHSSLTLASDSKPMNARKLKELISDAKFLGKSHLLSLNSIYSTFHLEQKKESVTLKEMVEYVFPEDPFNLTHQLAVLFHCLEDSIHFIFSFSKFRENQVFIFQNHEFAKNLTWALEIAKDESQHSIFQSFVDKCSLIMKSKTTHAPDYWSDTDLRLIQLLKAFVLAPKENHRHFVFASSFILKPLNFNLSDPSAARSLLTQIGFCHPLENFSLISKRIKIEGLGHSEMDEAHEKINAMATKWLQSIHSTSTTVHDRLASHRIDMGSLPVYTIDNKNASEVDDGISIEMDPITQEVSWVHIHVADPSSFLPFQHPLVSWAKQRVVTLYFPESKYYMFPPILSQHYFSLDSFLDHKKEQSMNEKKTAFNSTYGHAITFSAKLNSKGDILDIQFRPTLLRNIIPLTYDSLDIFFNSLHASSSSSISSSTSSSTSTSTSLVFSNRPECNKNPKFESLSDLPTFSSRTEKEILALSKLADCLRQKRLEYGALEFSSFKPQVSVELPSDFQPLFHQKSNQSYFGSSVPWIDVRLDTSNSSKSHRLVAEFMVLAGRIASMFAQKYHLKLPFRGQLVSSSFSSLPSTTAPSSSSSSPSPPSPSSSSYAYPSMLPSYFSSSPVAHSSLGVKEGYVRVTSPIRRYLDLFSHYQFQQYLLNLPQLEFPDMSKWMYQEAMLRKVQSSREIWWVYYLLYLNQFNQEKKDWIYQARVEKLPEKVLYPSYLILLTELGIKGMLPSLDVKLEVGDRIQVQVKSVEPYMKRLELMYIGKL